MFDTHVEKAKVVGYIYVYIYIYTATLSCQGMVENYCDGSSRVRAQTTFFGNVYLVRNEQTSCVFLLFTRTVTYSIDASLPTSLHYLYTYGYCTFDEISLKPIQRNKLDLAKNPIDLVSVGLDDDSDIYNWEILIMGPDGTLYEGGFFKARLVFPKDFPNMPPTMTFTSEMWHPNVYEDGRVCISILHPPGEDEFNQQESAEERWRPILGVEQILISVISMLSDPNDESPANLDAAVMWRNDRAAFKKKVRQIVRKSQEEC